jgi:hypothetical protein
MRRLIEAGLPVAGYFPDADLRLGFRMANRA